MKGSLQMVVFSAILGVVCAGLLAGANRLLAPYQTANEQAEKWRVLFTVLDVDLGGGALADMPAGELLALAEQKVATRHVAAGAEELTVYRYDHPQAGPLRAVEFAGPGLWGPVEGLLCLKADLRTVFRISFYKNEETPGLGGEIQSPGFRERFIGKQLGPDGIEVVKPGSPTGPGKVDGISGATLTCDKVAAMLKQITQRIDAHRAEILGGTAHGH